MSDQTKTYTFIVRQDVLDAALFAAAIKDIRYYLNGVHIEDSHVVATDGHRIHIVRTGEVAGFPTQVTIPLPTLRAVKALKLTEVELTVTETQTPIDDPKSPGDTIIKRDFTFSLADMPFECVSKDGLKYPDWRRLIPTPLKDGEHAPTAVYNPEYLRDVARAARAIATGRKAPLKDAWARLVQTSQIQPSTFISEDSDGERVLTTLYAIVLPLRATPFTDEITTDTFTPLPYSNV